MEDLAKSIPAENFCTDDLPTCNKNTKGTGHLRSYARGTLVYCSGGGNIMYFNPLYK